MVGIGDSPRDRADRGVAMTRERLRQAAETWTDWRGTCQLCGTTRTGTLAMLREDCPGCRPRGLLGRIRHAARR